jgi:hypothetical protein
LDIDNTQIIISLDPFVGYKERATQDIFAKSNWDLGYGCIFFKPHHLSDLATGFENCKTQTQLD